MVFHVMNNYCLLIPTDPGIQNVDGDVSEDVPRVSLEEMLQEMTIT